ncbi:MAG: hypothetical protein HC875_37375 [Anaerolineales bacterium]|nr:hypothetical protein [Anaerolineales bacterium]
MDPFRASSPLPNPPHSLQANLADQIKLLGYTTPNLQYSTGTLSPISNLQSPRQASNLQITLYWQALTSSSNLTRFVQLIGPDGQIYGQNDSAPDSGQYPTSLWQPGEVVVETVTLPLQPEPPPGDYTLHVGLYQPDSGTRLPLAEGGDHIEISVTIAR